MVLEEDKTFTEVVQPANRFANLTAIQKPPIEIVKFGLIQAHHNLIEAYEFYEIKAAKNVNPSGSMVYIRARLKRLIRQLKPILERRLNKMSKSGEELTYKVLLDSADAEPEKVLTTMDIMTDFLDGLGLTKIDTDSYDHSNAELEDEMKGL